MAMMFTPFEPTVSFRYLLESTAFGGIKYLCKAISLPSIDQGEVVIDYINTDFKVKGKSRWQDVTLTIYDTVGNPNDGSNQGAFDIHYWLNLHHNSSNGVDNWAFEEPIASGYKDMFTIKVLTPGGGTAYKWELHGAFMSAVNFGSLDWAAEDAVTAEVTIKYDWAQYIPEGSPGAEPGGF